jgi:hypothetical protein
MLSVIGKHCLSMNYGTSGTHRAYGARGTLGTN